MNPKFREFPEVMKTLLEQLLDSSVVALSSVRVLSFVLLLVLFVKVAVSQNSNRSTDRERGAGVIVHVCPMSVCLQVLNVLGGSYTCLPKKTLNSTFVSLRNVMNVRGIQRHGFSLKRNIFPMKNVDFYIQLDIWRQTLLPMRWYKKKQQQD